MIKKILFILLIGLLIAGFGLVVMREPGFAVFSYGETTIEIELIKFYFGVVASFIILYTVLRLLGYLFRLPRHLSAQRRQKHQLETMLSIESSLFAARKYNWESALHKATTHVKSSPVKLLQHTLAARYAHSLGNKKVRDTQIAKARALEGGSSLANSIEAEFALDSREASRALSLIRDEKNEDAANLNILARAYLQAGNAPELNETLSKLHAHVGKSKHVRKTAVDSLSWLIRHFDENANAEQLASLWKTHSKLVTSELPLLRSLVHGLRKHHENVLAERIITTQLKDQWDEPLVQEYGLLKLDNNEQRISQAESWLKQHKDSASLLLTLGRLHKQEKLWGKAKSYLESSLSRKPLAAAYAELAEIHEFLDESTDAQRCAKKGLHIAIRD